MSLRGQIAIAGIGHTAQGELPGRSAEELAVEAIDAALEDAGLQRSDVDGLVTCKSIQGRGSDVMVGPLLGIDPRYAQTLDYGTCNFSLHLAAMAVASGMAEVVALCYGANARSGLFDFGIAVDGTDLTATAGLMHIAGPAGLALQRHKHLYGTTDEQFGSIAVSARTWARRNPLAIFRDEMTIGDYLAMPYVVEPLRRPDLTMISDGGVALVVTTAERAAHLRHRPVYLLGMAEQSSLRGDQNPENLMRPWLGDVAGRIWKSTGMRPANIDVLFVQDPTAVWILQMLEYYGFCRLGEGGAFVQDGNTLPGGSLPLNTNGGQLSEAYAWGWLHICEAVRQLRGDAGERQVADATTAMYCSTQAFSKGAASILGLDPR